MQYTAGIDLGSGFTKALVLASGEEAPRVIGRGTARSGVDLEAAGRNALDAALHQAGISAADLCYTATTGLGRYGFSGRDVQITDITSAARGAHFLVPGSSLVLDIGSQATRAIAVTPEGKVKAFKTNDKCAAGSGSFIVRAAKYLQVPLESVGDLALNGNHPQMISSICAVLAESEIINLVSAGLSVEDILRGIYDSLAERAATLLRRVGMTDEVTFIGGVARQAGMVRALEARLKVPVRVPRNSDLVCAAGAALLGLRRLNQSQFARTVEMQIPA
ncbi:MAG TPA: acyl-CoA dehydratase activase [Thermoanaerobaculia bacterium]|nr:acyl-CoA dehydratase activase [Thermoanaerobaculia bacterium]